MDVVVRANENGFREVSCMCEALLELAKEEVEKKMKEEIEGKVREEVEEKVREEVEGKVREEIEGKVREEVEEKVKEDFEEQKELARKEEKITIAIRMRQKGLLMQQIAELTGLSEDEVEEIIKER